MRVDAVRSRHFLTHPLANVRRTILDFDTHCFARFQPTQTIDVDDQKLRAVQRDPWRDLRDLRIDLLDFLRSKFARQRKSGLSVLRDALDLHGQGRPPSAG